MENMPEDMLMGIDLKWLTSSFPYLSRIEPLQRSGQKWVFRCEHSNYGPCALKLIKPGAQGRLDRELEAVNRLSSDNVPRVYEVGLNNHDIVCHRAITTSKGH